MRRTEIAVLFLVAVIGGAVGTGWYFRQAPIRTDAQAVRAIVAEELAKQPQGAALDAGEVKSIVSGMLAEQTAGPKQDPVQSAALDPKSIDPMIENYLTANPQILQRMSDALTQQNKIEAALQQKQAIAANSAAIFNDPDNVVLGNPKGDVTLVEMFDYNCSYCRGALPDLATLLSTDNNLKVELKQFPILSAESIDAARVAVQVAKSGANYWAFHQALFTSRGMVDGNTALDAAKALGLNPDTLRAGMQAPAVTAALANSYNLAKALNVSGTPTYIIGDEIIPGAVPIDVLKSAIANVRACGSAVSCPNSG